MKGGIQMFKGNRTYMTIASIVLVAIAGAVGSSEIIFLSPEVTAAAIGVLGALAMYFRREA